MVHLTSLIFVLLLALGVPSADARDMTGDNELSICEYQEICALESFYRARGLDMVWFRSGRLTRQGKDVIKALDGAKGHGFDPDQRYRLSEIRDLVHAKHADKAIQKADFMMSAALYAYLSDLNGGDIGAQAFEDVVALRAIGAAVDGYIPDDRLYKMLMIGLEERQGLGIEPVQKLTFGRRFLRPGRPHPSVPELRVRLADRGFPSTLEAGADPFLYAGSLIDAVKAFQETKGEKTDGVIGPDTLALINRGVEDEIAQIVTNMQRLRDMRRDRRAPKRVEVSIAEYRLQAFLGGDVAMDMPVIVGKPKRQTVSFETEIRGVRFNPGWTVPDTIKKEDYLPKLVQDPTYLQSKNIRILSDWTGDAQEVDPTSIDWASLSEGELKAMRMFKPAGRSNPLGQIRVLMHNPYDIFIHDTNSPRLFTRAKRAYSSGCIRVAEPIALTNFLFNSAKKNWDDSKAEYYLNRGRTADILLDERIPVHLDYLTAWLDDDGALVLGQDVYSLDRPVAESLDIYDDKGYLRPLLHVNLFLDIVNEPILEAEALRRI